MEEEKKTDSDIEKTWKFLVIVAVVTVLTVIMLWAYNYFNPPKCSDYQYTDCPSQCMVCPPCATCSSLRCQTKDFCNSIGWNWTNAVCLNDSCLK